MAMASRIGAEQEDEDEVGRKDGATPLLKPSRERRDIWLDKTSLMDS